MATSSAELRPSLPRAAEQGERSDPHLAVTKEYEGDPPVGVDESPIDQQAPTREYATPRRPNESVASSEIGRGYRPTTALCAPVVRNGETSSTNAGRYQPTTETYGAPSAPNVPTSSPPTDEGPLDGPLGGTPYRALEKLGAGGMGEVYEAEDLEVGERAVVKVLRDAYPALVERMDREAEALARLRHPNIVEVSRYSRNASDHPYLAMERLYGRTLHEELRRKGAFSVPDAIHLTHQVLQGLAEAHGAGLLHRDIKLANLFLCDPVDDHSQILKIIDFGLTKDLPASDAVTRRKLVYPTEEDAFVGTARYAAPEQAAGRVDERADLYAVGLVLYALLTGREPFDDVRGTRDLLLAHQHRTLDFRFPRPIPARLERILRRAVAKDPSERFSTAIEFANALQGAGPGDLVNDEEVSVSMVPTGDSVSVAIRGESSGRVVPARARKRQPAMLLMAAAIISAAMFAALTAVAVHWLTR